MKHFLIALCTLFFSSLAIASGGWQECDVVSSPAYDSDDDECGNGNRGEAWVNVKFDGSFTGDAYAVDGQIGCDITVHATESGYRKVTCLYEVSEENPGGFASADVKAEVWGDLYLIAPDCEGAAIGYMDVVCNVAPTATARLTKSQGATGSSNAGDIGMGYGGFSIRIPITGGLHGDTHKTDHQVRDFYGQACVNYYTETITGNPYAYCHANGNLWNNPFGSAAVRIDELRGEGSASEVLSECPHGGH
ncbi:MAG: hypothetical protein QF903_02020 [Planctomycetota bacterium]|nr:hypothetical protein [Planctomycetota bacterium]MDP6988241.1 hypothetical protein [Planctomycetota bacterium]